MLENEIKISEMASGGRLLAGDMVPIRRGASNLHLTGDMLQSRLWYPDITDLVGGVLSALDGIPTLLMPNRMRAEIYVDGQLQFWLLVAGTAATDTSAADPDPAVRGTTGIVRPADYAAATNERNWVRIL